MRTSILVLCFASLPHLGLAGSAQETFIVYRGFPAERAADEEKLGYQGSQVDEIESASLADVSVTKAPDPGEEYVPSTTWNGGHEYSWSGCEDKAPEQTGFEVHTEDGFLSYASCEQLQGKCHNWVNSSHVQEACPISCFICDPSAKVADEGPPCYDSAVTGIRFKLGPQATCLDLANYCNHTTLWYHVQAACRMTCGLCEAHVGHIRGKCHDLETHDQPEYIVAGRSATCTDLIDFCEDHPDSYIIKHKCPRTCGACPDQVATTTAYSFTTSRAVGYDAGSDEGTCDRRRRWGHCSTRRRRNL